MKKYVNGIYHERKIEGLIFNYRDGLLTDNQGDGGIIKEEDQERVILALKSMCKSIFMPFKDIVDERVQF